MSVEVTLYTKKATKTGLIKILSNAGFKKVQHFIPGMNTPDMLHYMWFGYEDYESTTGVEAMVYKASDETREKFKCSDWILHTRTRAGGSYEDKKMQNDIIRKARQQFGGTFYNDWYGTNKYTNLDDYAKYSPLEKHLARVGGNAIEKLEQIVSCLDNYTNPVTDNIASIPDKVMRDLFVVKDPSITLYNSLLPFLVSVIEYFFGQSFEGFIKYDEDSKQQLIDEKLKLGVSDVLEILDKKISLEEIIAKTYNFQNLDSINRAFRKYTGVDVFSVLSERKKINNKVVRILTKFEELLQARHRFVHELEINYGLKKQDYLDCVKTVEIVVSLMLDAFRKKGLSIEILY